MFGPGNGRGMGGLGEWGDPAREWTQSAPFGPPCVPTNCDPVGDALRQIQQVVYPPQWPGGGDGGGNGGGPGWPGGPGTPYGPPGGPGTPYGPPGIGLPPYGPPGLPPPGYPGGPPIPGLTGDPGFRALLTVAGRAGQALQALASPTGGAAFQQLAPHQGAPFRARPLAVQARAVLNASGAVAGSAATISASFLASAESFGVVSSTVLSVLPPIALVGGGMQLLLNFTVPAGFRLSLQGVGVEIGDGERNAVNFQVVVGAQPPATSSPLFTRPTGGSPLMDPTPLAMFSTLTEPIFVPALVTENTTLQIWAQNLDENSPMLVEARMTGWIYPALQQADSLDSSLSQAPCAPSGTDRLDCPPCGYGGGM